MTAPDEGPGPNTPPPQPARLEKPKPRTGYVAREGEPLQPSYHLNRRSAMSEPETIEARLMYWKFERVAREIAGPSGGHVRIAEILRREFDNGAAAEPADEDNEPKDALGRASAESSLTSAPPSAGRASLPRATSPLNSVRSENTCRASTATLPSNGSNGRKSSRPDSAPFTRPQGPADFRRGGVRHPQGRGPRVTLSALSASPPSRILPS